MDKSSKSAKLDYQALLKERAISLFEEMCGIAPVDPDQMRQIIDLLTKALKSTALESWKNGFDAGRRRAQSPAAKPQAWRKGYAGARPEPTPAK